ncbi:MAG: hypothetical protein EXS00_06850 [Phycisphaerales bacterium]|nr:hypothetical protein [Phycisphaerales bacterium]
MSGYLGWCSDFFVNQKLALKMDLPSAREPVLELFDRIRKHQPSLSRIKRTDTEVALESTEGERSFQWVSLRQTTLRSGVVNPDDLSDAYRLHKFILETAPWFLSISPIDIDHLDLVFGFDFEAEGCRDGIVAEALLSGCPLAALLDGSRDAPIDVQPFIGFTVDGAPELRAYLEVKTRPAAMHHGPPRHSNEPISVYLTVRREGSVAQLEDLPAILASLSGHAERLAEERVIPHIVQPLLERIRAQ